MCGEKIAWLRSKTAAKGSPPHVRGKDTVNQSGQRGLGITPACAGKSGSLRFSSGQCRDHPRMCGEKQDESPLRAVNAGSPPHVRGKVYGIDLYSMRLGITPACAGKRPHSPLADAAPRDHPRMCGEKCRRPDTQAPVLGSPPHVRGKADFDVCPDRQCGITPACAGKSAFGLLSSAVSGDHPRMCGEKMERKSRRCKM